MYQIKARVVKGEGKGAKFLEFEWVKEKCIELLGFVPYPGTLNLEIPIEDKNKLTAIARRKGKSLSSPCGLNFCSALLLPAQVESIKGALIFPEEKVWKYANEPIVEFIAPFSLRKILGLKEGLECALYVYDIN